MNKRLRIALFPPSTVDEDDHGLVFTDILFGFVIYEIFTQFSTAPCSCHVVLHLLLAASLVLGSWIGFRRSRNRLKYHLKFFNLPFWRFAMDQAMIVLYFKIATLARPKSALADPPKPQDLVGASLCLTALVFVLYVCWDVFGLLMLKARSANGSPKYTRAGDKDGKVSSPDWCGMLISIGALTALVLLCWIARAATLTNVTCNLLLIAAIFVLLAYRMLKEIRTSFFSL